MNEMELKKNDEFKKKVKKQQVYFSIFLFLGIATTITFSLFFIQDYFNIHDSMKGIYTGLGSGTAVVAIMSLIKNRRVLKDEEKMKKKRIEETDERNLKLQSKSISTAAFFLFITLYIGVIVGGIWNPIISFVLAGYVLLFAIVKGIVYTVLQKKM
jgi:protein-S-isoprenylcysteine O-methyltransferase Ste14